MVKLTKEGELRIHFRDFLPEEKFRLFCNYSCSYCNQNDVQQIRFGQKELEQAKTLWDDLSAIEDKLHVRMNFDGEIFADSISRQIAVHICSKENVASFEVITNNSFPPKTYLHEFDLLKLSLNCSYHPECTSFERFMRNINQLRDAGCPVFATMVVTPQLVPQFEDIVLKFKAENVLFRPLLLLGKYVPPYTQRWKKAAFVLNRWRHLRGLKFPAAYTDRELQLIRPHYYSPEEFKYQYGEHCKSFPCRAGMEMINVYMGGYVRRCFAGKMGTVEELLIEKYHLFTEPKPCPAKRCQCPTHMMFLEECRQKYELSEKFADLYLLEKDKEH